MSFPYRRILCPIDFDDNSAAAIREAGKLARLVNAVVVLLHAVRINPLATEGFVLADLEESLIKDANTKAAAAAKRELDGIPYEIKVEVGEPADLILAMENELNADLVVMATHGRRGVTRLVLGSVAERIVRESTVPVLTIRAPAS